MKNLEFLMDDSSIRNEAFVIENNIEKVKSYTNTYTYELENNILSDQIII